MDLISLLKKSGHALPVLVVGGSLDIQWLRQALKLYLPDSNKRNRSNGNSEQQINK